MDEKDNRVVGNFAWLALAVLVLFFIVYGWFAPRAYGAGESPLTLEQALSVGALPWCDGGGISDFSSEGKYPGVQAVPLTPEIRSKVVLYLELRNRHAFTEKFLSAAAVVALVWSNEKNWKYAYDTRVFYFPVNKDVKGRWCSDEPGISNPTQLPDEEVKNLLKSKQK